MLNKPKPKKSKTEKVTVDPMTGRKTYTVKGKIVGNSATSTYGNGSSSVATKKAHAPGSYGYKKGTSSVGPGPGVPAKASTPAAKKPAPKPAPKKEYDSYTDFFKGNNTYAKGTKGVKKKC